MQKTKILIADDDPLILELLGMLITSYGCEFKTAADGLQAAELLNKDRFDIVITDIMMPNMDGMELLKYITSNHPGIDVIVITGYGGTFSYTDVIRAGASDYLSKPFNSDELEAKLNRIVRERKLIIDLERMSMSDGLTNLYNRRFFDTKLWEEAHRANRQNYNLLLAMVDVDRFKEYNDTFGHQAGDIVLQTIGNILTSLTRDKVDLVFRFGGDEFAVILPQTSMNQARQVGERVIKSYCACNFANTGLSIGLAEFQRQSGNSWEDDVADLVKRADLALYQAKSTGKNRVFCAPQP